MSEYEDLVAQAMVDAKSLQDFLWHDNNQKMGDFDPADWIHLFQKRVDKLSAIDRRNPIWRQEVRKRLLQQAALSLQAILALENGSQQEQL